MSYTAGSLELSVLGISNASVANVDNAAKALRRLASAVDKVNMQQFVFAGDKLEVLFSKIAKATNSINTGNLTTLASAAKSLNAVSRLGNLEKLDYGKISAGFSNLTIAITPFVDKVKEAEVSLTALNGILGKTSGKKIQNLLGGGGNKGGGFGNFLKLGLSVHLMKRLGREAANVVQEGSNYNEALNLWQVAMRENLDLADQFVAKMNKAYGISTKNLMTAQATFRNMIGSLGQISDEVAYELSEALVLMSADYSSLYNRSLESAIQNMQSMLAGQVRPIRSAGLDITESTLFMFYQQLGGTKTMRQLNRTEKQLLSILAVYKQMGRAGALGDMTKTLNTFANQSRMLTEYWAELKTWSGLILMDWIDQNQILVKINAALIFMTEVIKAIAKSRGLGEENFLTGMFESADATNDAVDELQGKLLDFDKFRSLEGGAATPFTIDDKVIEAITGYESQIENAVNAAQNLAEEWQLALGWTKDENGELTISEEKLKNLKNVLKGIGFALGFIIGLGVFSWLVKTGIGIYTYAIKPLGTLIIAIGNFVQVLYGMNTIALGSSAKAIFTMTAGFIGLAAAITGAFLIITNWSDMSTWQKIIGIVGVATTAILGLAMAFGVFHSAWSMGLATAGIAAGIAMIVGSIASVKKDIEQPIQFAAVGASDIHSGTLFVAGEMGKTEAVFTGNNGKTNVANVRQMRQAFYGALSEWTNDYLSGALNKIAKKSTGAGSNYNSITADAKAKGKVWANT